MTRQAKIVQISPKSKKAKNSMAAELIEATVRITFLGPHLLRRLARRGPAIAAPIVSAPRAIPAIV
jgi:hypothetical protein